jgi:hypothetical protein
MKVDGCTGGYDILGPDGVLFRTKLARNHVEGEWLDWDKMMHVWPLIECYGICPESHEAFLWIADLLRRRLDGVEEDKVVLNGVEGSLTSNGQIADDDVAKI